jgi:hypothetical protein
VQAAKLFSVALSIFTSPSWNLLHTIHLAPRTFEAAPRFLEKLCPWIRVPKYCSRTDLHWMCDRSMWDNSNIYNTWHTKVPFIKQELVNDTNTFTIFLQWNIHCSAAYLTMAGNKDTESSQPTVHYSKWHDSLNQTVHIIMEGIFRQAVFALLVTTCMPTVAWFGKCQVNVRYYLNFQA